MGLTARELMASFADRTGLTSARPQRRYLWTDAFAVCNFLGLGQRELALELIRSVHHQLGRDRHGVQLGGDEAHPTRGGLRIGKPLPERAAHEPLDERTEWDRDGQYFHYLTKWMHALDQTARTQRDATLASWSRELAVTAHRRFVHTAGGERRMYWKLSVDLTRPLVTSMGHHDPLDGYVTYLQLQATARTLGDRATELDEPIADFRSMLEPEALATPDPLGIGGLLFDAVRLAQLDRDPAVREALVRAASAGLAHYAAYCDLRANADARLAFRELGLGIGLAGADMLGSTDVARFAHLRDALDAFWSEPTHRQTRTYREHEDINDVMLATSLEPDGFIRLAT